MRYLKKQRLLLHLSYLILITALHSLANAQTVDTRKLDLADLKGQIESPYHAKRSFRLSELSVWSEENLAELVEARPLIHETYEEELVLSCKIIRNGHFFEEKNQSLTNIIFFEKKVRLVFTSYRNILLQTDLLIIECSNLEERLFNLEKIDYKSLMSELNFISTNDQD